VGEIRVLVIDDDVMLCRSVSRMLRPFAVMQAGGGAEALEILNGGEPFDVVLCDVMMPGMSGPELYHALADVRPELQARVLFMTGGMLDRVRPMMSGVSQPLIEKPFSRSEIKLAVERLAGPKGDGEPNAS